MKVKYGYIPPPRSVCEYVKQKPCDQKFATYYDFSAFAQDLDLHCVMLVYMKKANAGMFQSWDMKLKYDKSNLI